MMATKIREEDSSLYQTLLEDSRFFDLLLQLDNDLAAQARQVGCECGGVLHSARYRRKPRGGPRELGAEHAVRASFCCAVEGCRRRVTPPSLRFLGRKVFFGVLVLLLPVLMEEPTRRRLARLQECYAVSLRTLRRWRRWWQQSFAASRFFAAARGDFAQPVAADALPGALLMAFATLQRAGERVMAILRWLLPLSGGSSRQMERAFCGPPATRRGCVWPPV